jgi:hypothetical protein
VVSSSNWQVIKKIGFLCFSVDKKATVNVALAVVHTEILIAIKCCRL